MEYIMNKSFERFFRRLNRWKKNRNKAENLVTMCVALQRRGDWRRYSGDLLYPTT